MLASKARRTCLSAALLLGALSAGGCTLITDVDRSKIPSGTTAPPAQEDSGTDSGSSTPPEPTPDAAPTVPDSSVTDAGAEEPDASSPPVEPPDAA